MTTSAQTAGSAADPNNLNFSDAADSDLFEWMAAAEKCPAEARAAFAEFYRRHVKYLLAVCLKSYAALAEDIVSESFIRAYQKADKFDLKRLGSDAPTNTKKVRAWLGSVAHNVAADIFAAREKEPVTNPGTTSLPDDWGHDVEATELSGNDELIEKVRVVVNALPEREREITWVIAHSWRPGEKANRWSREDLAAIAMRFSETPENIRQLKCRLFKRLEKLLAPVLDANVSDR